MNEEDKQMSVIEAIRTAELQYVSRKWDTIYWAIDVYGTISKPNYIQSAIDYYPMAKETLKILSDEPINKLILYTCSYDNDSFVMLDVFEQDGIHFDFINSNPDVDNTYCGDFTKKPYFNILLDDKAGFDPHCDWIKIFKRYNNNGQ